MIAVLAGVLFLFVVLPCFLLGYFIGVKKRVHLISGYDPKKVEDPDGLAVWTGKLCNRIGGLTACIVVGIVLAPDYGRAISMSIAFVIMIVMLVYFVGARRYFKKPDPKDLIV